MYRYQDRNIVTVEPERKCTLLPQKNVLDEGPSRQIKDQSFTLSKFLTNRLLLLYKLQKRDISDMYYGSFLALYSNVVYKGKLRGRTMEPVNENCKSILL